ncbi:MAG: T9SS type A sorting domain-containing protein [Bacteroidota bacterium]
MYKTITFFLLLALLSGQYAFGQCNVPTPNCQDARPIFSNQTTVSLLDGINNSGSIPGCSGGFSYHNTSWHSIDVLSTSLAIRISTDNFCGLGLGFQAGLYASCDPNDPPVDMIQCSCTLGDVNFSTSSLQPGTYFLMLDGCSGDFCDLNVEIIDGVIGVDSTNVLTIDTPTVNVNAACSGAIVNASVNPSIFAEGYTWNLPPGVIPLSLECNEAIMIWGDSSGEISVTAYNGIDTVQSAPVFVEVINYETDIEATYCTLTNPEGYFYAPTSTFFQEGVYNFNLLTSSSCDSLINLTVTAFSELPVIETSVTSESCEGIDDGVIYVDIQNPEIGPFTFEWSNGSTQADSLTGLPPGQYSLTLTAEGGCFVEESFEIFSNIEMELTGMDSDCDSLTGSATAVVTGGGNVNFAWSNGGTGTIQTGLAPGGYSVTATDATTNCRTHRNIIINYDSSCVSYITGHVYEDSLGGTCTSDSALGFSNIMVQLDNGQATFTDANGYYEFEVEPGTYTVEVIFNSLTYAGVCVDPILVDASVPETYSDNDFYLKILGLQDLQLKVSKPNPRPGFSRSIRVCLMNVGTVPMSGTLTFVHDDNQEYVSSSPVVTNYDLQTRTLSWDFANLPPGEIWIFYPFMNTPLSVPTGQNVDYYFRADPITGDATPDNNEWSCSLITTNAYDPNDKQVMPEGEGPEGLIEKTDTLLSYQVRFQNTGTDTAYTVVIRDTLDENLDLETLFPGPSSHDYELDVLPGRVLEFTFNNIYLPDSFVNEPASNGFVFFDIQLQPNLPEGTAIENTAAIYFDFNPPIITNTVISTIKTIVGTAAPGIPGVQLTVQPNPTRQTGWLAFNLPEAEQASLQLYDLHGRHLAELQPPQLFVAGEHRIAVDFGDRPAGLYFLRLQTSKGTQAVVRWVKMN